MTIQSTAVGGNWTNVASWTGGVVPALGVADANVIAGSEIVVDAPGCGCGTNPGAGVAGLTVNGTLKYSTAADSDLTVRGDVVVNSGGVLYDGTLLNAAYGVRKHKLIIDCVTTIGKYKLHVKDGAIFKPNSTLPTPWYTRLSADCASGQAVIRVTEDVKTAGWKVGDLVVIPHCLTDDTTYIYLQTEIREIASFDVTGKEITVTANLTYTHNKVMVSNAKVTWKRNCPVVLLSRDIVIESADPDYPAWVNNSTITDMTKWYPKGVELKCLGKSAAQPSVCYASDPASAPFYNNPAYGSMSGISAHPGKDKKGYPGVLYGLYKYPGTLADHDFSNIVVVGNAIQGADGGSTYLFSEAYSITHKINISTLFAFGSSGLSAVNFGGLTNEQKKVTITDFEAAGFVYGPQLAKVGSATDIHVWGCAYIGIYQTSLNFSAENVVALAGYYAFFGSAYSIKNIIENLYTKTSFATDIGSVPDIEITNWVSDGVTLYGIFAGLVEIRVNDFQGVTDNTFTCIQEGVKYSCKSTFAAPRDKIRTAGKGALLLDPESATLALTSEKEVSVEASKAVIVSGYMYKDAAYNGSAEPSVRLTGAGMTEVTVLYTAMTDAGGGWYQWTVSGTPTRTTQAYLYISCIGTAGYVVVADVIVLGADVNTGDFLNWSHGASAKILFAIKLPAADVATAVWEKVISTITTANSAAVFIKKIKSLIMIK